jgi:GTP-binding protein
MADGCLLVVDAIDGPMPQTRYVLKIAMQHGLRPVVIINKIDRSTLEIETTIDAINDLFLDLATDAEQLDFPIVYTSAKDGYAIINLRDKQADMTPLFEAIIEHIPPPKVDLEGNLQILVAALDYDQHLGQIAIGRVFRGNISKGQPLILIGENEMPVSFRAEHLFTFKDLSRFPVNQVEAGDIVAVTGCKGATIGDTIAALENPEPLERISIEKPTVKMNFGVNTSPFSGRDGKPVTSRVLWDRLQRELQTNVSLKVDHTEFADEFTVSGRGELHLSVLIENLRREGIEFQVSKPEAITKSEGNQIFEPYERIHIDIPDEYLGSVAEELASRLAILEDMQNNGLGRMKLSYQIPTRGLIGFRSFLLKATRGSAVLNSELLESRVMKGMIKSTRFGAMVASETGTAVANGIKNLQERGQTFVPPNTPVYQGMVVGMHNRDQNLDVNICKEKKQTNMRAAAADVFERLEPPIIFSLDESLEFIADDEIAEITPNSIRLRKRILNPSERHRGGRTRIKS